MNRQDIILNNNIFIADYYNFDELKIHHYDNFIMLRYYDYINGIAIDKDIYFIEKNIFNDYIKDLYINQSNVSKLIDFPCTNAKTTYSKSFEEFNPLYNKKSLYKEIIINKNGDQIIFENNNEIIVNKNINITEDYIYINDIKINDNLYKIYIKYGNEVYKFYSLDDNNEMKENNKIPCDKIKIYHPISLLTLNGIIHIDSYINGINFHFLCRNYKNLKTYSESEFVKNNSKYSEYVEIYIPNISYLFDLYNNIYYIEDINIINFTNKINNNFINSILINYKSFDYIKFGLFSQPYKIDESIDSTVKNKIYVKTYLNKQSQLYNNYLSHTLNITIYAIDDTDVYKNNIYVLDNVLLFNTCTFIDNYKFKLKCQLGFNDNNIISIKNSFDFPYKNKFKTFGEAYKHFNNITENDYANFTGLENIDYNILPEEIEEETGIPLNFVGYKLEIFSKINSKNKIYNKLFPINLKSFKFDDLNNFYMNLNKIFNKWDELPNKLFIIVTFIDNYLGTKISGNLIIIYKEWLKFLINPNNNYNINLLNKLNDNIKYNINDNMEITEITDLSKINFLNNVTCVINKVNNDKKINNLTKNNTAKILYKPYFYRTQDLQQIYIREHVEQNIGINLSEYMTKVEAFKLIINGYEYNEIGRNDIYIIFKINAANIKINYGKYDIMNQDDEYISSGNYNIY